jgi:hypothetical protein
LPWSTITEKKKPKQTQKLICMLKVSLQFANTVSHDAFRGALKWFICLVFVNGEREVIQRIQGF